MVVDKALDVILKQNVTVSNFIPWYLSIVHVNSVSIVEMKIASFPPKIKKAKKIIESEKLSTTPERNKVKLILDATVNVKTEKKRKLVSKILDLRFMIAIMKATNPRQMIKL